MYLRKMKKMMFKQAIQHVKNLKGKRPESKHGVSWTEAQMPTPGFVGTEVSWAPDASIRGHPRFMGAGRL